MIPRHAYNTKHDKRAFELSLLGLPNARIAKALRLDTETLRDWIQRYPTFADAIHRGSDLADAAIAGALHKRALGMICKTTTTTTDPNGNVTICEQERELPPDVASGKLFLQRRQGWTDRSDITSGGAPLTINSISFSGATKTTAIAVDTEDVAGK